MSTQTCAVYDTDKSSDVDITRDLRSFISHCHIDQTYKDRLSAIASNIDLQNSKDKSRWFQRGKDYQYEDIININPEGYQMMSAPIDDHNNVIHKCDKVKIEGFGTFYVKKFCYDVDSWFIVTEDNKAFSLDDNEVEIIEVFKTPADKIRDWIQENKSKVNNVSTVDNSDSSFDRIGNTSQGSFYQTRKYGRVDFKALLDIANELDRQYEKEQAPRPSMISHYED